MANKKIFFAKNLILITIFLALIGCAKTEDEETLNLQSNKSSLDSSLLNGTWSTLCVSQSGNSYKRKITFSNPTYNFIDEKYLTSNNCLGDSIVLRKKGTFKIGQAYTTPTGSESKEINFSYQDASTGEHKQTYDIFNLSENRIILYLGDNPTITPPNNTDSSTNSSTDLNYDLPYFNGTIPTSSVTFYNDLNIPISSIFIRLSSDQSTVDGENKLTKSIPPNEAATISVICGEIFNITIKSDGKIAEEKFNVKLNCNKDYSWPIDGE